MTTVAPGTVLAGKYRVTKVLGQGGMGVVVAAVHIQLDEPVALKFMLPEALGSAEYVGRFLREARAAVKLKSEHVARVSDVGTLETGAPYIVMEYLQGADLSALLSMRGSLPVSDAVEYVVQACDALAEAHALGIVHRDLKPANLFLTHRRDGSPLVKVLDFGISKSSTLNESGGESLTKTGGLMGSPVYMSPEQMKSAKDTDGRTDLWALGVILYELLSGRTPFRAETLGGLMATVLTERPPPLAELRPDVPPLLCQVIERCLEKERANRWGSVADFARALAPFAPPRALMLIERMSGIASQPLSSLASTAIENVGGSQLGSQSGSRTGPGGSAPARTGPGSGGTAPGWAEASGTKAPKSGRSGAVFAVVGAVVAIGAGVGWLALRHASSVPPPIATIVTVPATTSAAASSAAVPSAPVPPPPSPTAIPSALATTVPEAAAPPAVDVEPKPPSGSGSHHRVPPSNGSNGHAGSPASTATGAPPQKSKPSDLLDTSN